MNTDQLASTYCWLVAVMENTKEGKNLNIKIKFVTIKITVFFNIMKLKRKTELVLALL